MVKPTRPPAPPRSCKVPWVVGATVERVVRLHEQLELREVALGGDDGARLAKAAHQLRIVALEIGGTTDEPGGGRRAHDIEALLDGDRHPVKLLAVIGPAPVGGLRGGCRLVVQGDRHRVKAGLHLVLPIDKCGYDLGR